MNNGKDDDDRFISGNIAMQIQLTLTSRDIEILRFLSLRVRVAARSQITRTWWPDARGAHVVRRRLDKLESAGLIRSIRGLVALPVCIEPVCRWAPGDYRPDFGAIAWRLQRRFTSKPTTECIYSSTANGARRFGGVRRDYLAHPFQLSHDLGVAEMFFAVLAARPYLAERWIDEDRLAPYRKRQKLPDAVIADGPASAPSLVLEFGGAYPKHRLAEFHDDCQDRGLPYEIW